MTTYQTLRAAYARQTDDEAIAHARQLVAAHEARKGKLSYRLRIWAERLAVRLTGL